MSTRLGQAKDVELIVVNDDPRIDLKPVLLGLKDLQLQITLISHDRNMGIVPSLNEAIQKSSNDWILFLDCDDCLTDETLSSLSFITKEFRNTHYVSSNMIDLCETTSSFYRPRTESQRNLLSTGMVAGHLKCVHRDAFQKYGFLDSRFEKCQDYEFAMRLACFENILFDCHYLYQYRWHPSTQSTTQQEKMDFTAEQARNIYYQFTLWLEKNRKESLLKKLEFLEVLKANILG